MDYIGNTLGYFRAEQVCQLLLVSRSQTCTIHHHRSIFYARLTTFSLVPPYSHVTREAAIFLGSCMPAGRY